MFWNKHCRLILRSTDKSKWKDQNLVEAGILTTTKLPNQTRHIFMFQKVEEEFVEVHSSPSSPEPGVTAALNVIVEFPEEIVETAELMLPPSTTVGMVKALIQRKHPSFSIGKMTLYQDSEELVDEKEIQES